MVSKNAILVALVVLAIGVAIAILPKSPSPPSPSPLPPNPLPPCGSKQSLQIIDGRPSAAGKWPWQAGLISSAKCGGSLIAPSWILTAAHCIPYDEKKKVYLNPEDMDVYLGTLALQGNDPNKQIIPARKFFVHPGWDSKKFVDDIALVKLSKPATLNRYVASVCLPSKQYNFGGKTLVATGWGRISPTDTSLGSDTLNETTVFAACPPSKEVVPDTQICAINTTGGVSGGPTNVCEGDSGGPLVMQDGDTWILVGLTSYGGPVCAAYPGFYTNVFSYLEWIFETINDDP